MYKGNKAYLKIFLSICFLSLSNAIVIKAQTTYSGRAIGVDANVTVFPVATVNTRLADTGALPAQGWSLQSTLASGSVLLTAIGIGNTLDTGLITTATSGGAGGGTPGTSQSSATVNNTAIVLAGNIINATVLSTNSNCQCTLSGASCSGGTVVTNLVVNGLTVDVTGQPNQTVSLLNLVTLVINEQTSPQPGPGDITVNALRVTLANPVFGGVPLLETIIASSHSDISCPIVTAANVSISGRVTDASGNAVTRAVVSLIDASGVMRSAMTNSFGSYRFDDLPAGQTYILTAAHKRYAFEQKIISPAENLSNLNLTTISLSGEDDTKGIK